MSTDAAKKATEKAPVGDILGVEALTETGKAAHIRVASDGMTPCQRAKANFKRILFEDENLNAEDEGEYDKGMDLFKHNLNEKWVLEYGKKSKQRKLYVDIFFDFNADRLIVEVLNNRPISQKEDKRIKEVSARILRP